MFNNKSLLAGSTSMLILELVRNEDMYGYQITERLRTLSDNTFDIKAGTLYPLLHSLEKDGLVSVYEQPVNGKLRKYYAITEKGIEALEAKKNEWTVFNAAVAKIMGGGSVEGV